MMNPEYLFETFKEIADLHKQLSEKYEELSNYLTPDDEDENESSRYPIRGEKYKMLVDGEWKIGTVIEGYRYQDGIVTIETDEGKQYWCGQDRTDLYKPYKEK